MQGYRSAGWPWWSTALTPRQPKGPNPLGEVCLDSGCPWNTTPSGMLLCPRVLHTNDGANCSCSKPPSVEAEAVFTPNACVRPPPGLGLVPTSQKDLCLGPTTRAHHCSHPGKLSVLNASAHGWMPVHGMAKHRPDVAVRCCAGLGAQSGELGASRASAQCGIPFRGSCHLLGFGVDWYPPSMRGLLGVKDTAAPEVKFLDRCMINCSEGVLHLHVRRSRMRVWGAKMIRHRRSPLQ